MYKININYKKLKLYIMNIILMNKDIKNDMCSNKKMINIE
jgi:hypothetical protein